MHYFKYVANANSNSKNEQTELKLCDIKCSGRHFESLSTQLLNLMRVRINTMNGTMINIWRIILMLIMNYRLAYLDVVDHAYSVM